MYLIALYIFSIFSNIVGFLAAQYFVSGFIVTFDFRELLIAGAIFALINLLIRPVVRLLFTPIIFLTFGLGLLAVNALMLFILDKLSDGIIIEGILPLLYATLVMGVVNLVIHLAGRRVYKRA